MINWPIVPWLRQTFELQDPKHARLLPMEGLRGVAVTLVFLQHYTTQSELIGLPPGLTAVFAAALRNYGNQGVELFFVLSGYLIYGSLVRSAPPFARFMARRFQRIYPTFIVVFAFATALIVLVPIPDRIPSESWPAALYLVANLALLPGLFPIEPIVTVAWSLSYEMFFYLVTAAVVLGTGANTVSRRTRLIVLGCLTAAFTLMACADLADFPFRMMPFFAGMLLAEGVGQRVPLWLAWAAPCLGFVLVVTRALDATSAELVQTIALFSLCAVCFRGAGIVSAWLVWAPLRWLGNMSYSYYLAHGFVVRIGMGLLGHVLPHGLPSWLFWALMPALYGATLCVSSLLFVLVEKPLSLRPATVKMPRAAAL